MDKMYYKIVFMLKPNNKKLSKEQQRLILNKAEEAGRLKVSKIRTE
jgi:hypothetical protein